MNTPYIYPAILRLLYGCGTRIGETVRLKIEDVNLSDGIITLHNVKTMSHVCFLCQTLLQHISESMIRVLTEAEMLTFFQLLWRMLFSCYNT